MNEVLENLKKRRSIRAYTDQPVAREVLEDIVDFARLAATCQNEQPWEFVVVTDKAMLRRLPELTGHAQFIATAAACILVICQPTVHYVEDGSATSEHILLAAHAYGLGACWVAGEKEGYADSICQLVGAPAGYKLLCLIPVGYPAESPEMEKRTLRDVLHWETY
ncbi:MAG: nitroreductase family protein [Terracidiphilus sp.]|nr:nitroreductase family protein [Terracidiphilus sp.]